MVQITKGREVHEHGLLEELDLKVDATSFTMGASEDFQLRWSTADASNHAAVIAIGDTSQQIHITDVGAIATDWARSAGTHPELAIHSNTTPATDYLALGNHDGTTAYINVVGGTTLALQLAGTSALTLTATALTFANNLNMVFSTTTGTKIGTATGQKIGFFNATPVSQQADIAAGAATTTSATAAISSILALLAAYGLTA
jgi:hypothetical protein